MGPLNEWIIEMMLFNDARLNGWAALELVADILSDF